MNWQPTAEEYRRLYKRFLVRDPSELLEGVIKPGSVVLDLCCGPTLRASVRAVRLGAEHVEAVDMTHLLNRSLQEIADSEPDGQKLFAAIRCRPSEDVLRNMADTVPCSYDVVVCQQGINYWMDKAATALVARVLKKKGTFVFNTFNRMPTSGVENRRYQLDGVEYAETTNFIGDTVHHVQVVDGLPPHCNSFKWIPPEVINEWVMRFFGSISERRIGNTSIWTVSNPKGKCR